MSNPYNTLKERTSILGPTITFKGELSSEEDLVINGKIEGTVDNSTATPNTPSTPPLDVNSASKVCCACCSP